MCENTLMCICRIAFLALLFIPGIYAQGQGNRATVTGTVTDTSGAVVAGVNVTVTNVSTGETSHAVTNNDGLYSILNLFPGKYSLNFLKTGFKPIDIPDITLESTQVARFNETLAVGSKNETVTVTAAAPVLDTETATEGTHLSGQVITDLPLNINGGRDIEQFAYALTPGYSAQSNTYEAMINGTQIFTKDFTVDGTSGTATIQGDSVEIGPTMEALQEVEAQTSGLQVQNGITNGGVVMFNLKSGTNQFHGSAFDYGHNEFLDARSWGNPVKPKARFWDYGFSAGGPIRKNKLFYFGAFERYQQHDFTLGGLGSNTGAASVPTTAFLNGDFSALLNTSNLLGTDVHGNPIYAGAIFNPKDPGAVFVGNIIPQSMFSSVSQKILAIYQKDYAPESTAIAGNERIPANGTPEQTPNQIVAKGDYNLNDRNHISGSWVYDHRPRLNDDCGGVWQQGSTDGGPLSCDRFQRTVSNEFRASDSFTITPNLLNVFNATYNRYWNGSVPSETGTNWLSQLGLGNTGVDNFPAISFGSAVNGYGTTGIGNTWQGYYIGSTFIYGDNLSWTKGKHTFTFGGEFRAMQISSLAGSGALSLNFSNNTTGAPSEPYANLVGFGFASFLLGDVRSASESTPLDLYGRRKAMSLFAQDNWKVTPKLTMNIGLRWDATFRFHEKYGHWANFDLNAIDPNLGIKGAVVYANGGGDSFEKNEDWHNFGPQIGIAYNPWKRVVLRGSFGILYVPIGIQYYEGVPYGFAPGIRGTNVAPAPFNWDSGYPGVFMPGVKSSTLPINVLGVTVDPNALLAGYTDNWNLGVQYEINSTTRIEVSYIGNRGHHLQDSGLQNNQASAQQFFPLAKSGNGFNYVCSPADAAANGVPYPYSGFCAPAFAAIAPYPQLAAAALTYWFYPTLFYVGLPLGQSYYDSMVVQLIKRLSSGLTMDFSYTHARSEGDTVNNFGDSYDTASIQDFSNLSEAAHTLTPYDQKHTFKGAVTYELPFGHGRRWLTDRGKFVNGLVSGWRLSGIVLYASGAPLSFFSSNYYYYPAWAATYVDYNLADYKGSQFNAVNFSPPTATNQAPAGDLYFPQTVAANPPYATLGAGPARIDALRGFGIKNENASLMKNTYFGPEGRFRLQLRVEFYNIFNRHTFSNPDTNLNDITFGYVTGVNSLPRQGQFGIRFEW
ncbi:MAG TPA: carboxypeptidase regulatory-like domain-containing protein [Bryobacteraceae bacterium]|nr:carboxypeptidase regulatory-like domain-containing protein [Bryobacteraceae bacterium]